jgi:hypothetical protein
MRISAVLLIVLMAAGCSYVPLSSAMKLRRIDPLAADPRHIRIAVRLPDGLQVRDGGAVMEIGARRQDKNEVNLQKFVFEKSPGGPMGEAEGLAPEDGTHVEIFRVAERDIVRIQALQEKIRAWKADAPDDVKGSLSIGASGCRISALPQGPLYATTYLKTEPASPFFAVTRKADLRKLAGSSLEDELPPCEPAI